MGLNVNTWDSIGDSDSMEAGTYPAFCIGVVDIGTQTSTWNGETKLKKQVIFIFEFPTETIKIDGKDMPRNLSRTFTQNMGSLSGLRKMFTDWRGRDFTGDELRDFNLTKVLGVPASIAVIVKEKEGKSYANISTVSKLQKGTTLPKPSRMFYFDLDDEDSWESIETMPNWIISRINQSAECVQRKKVFMKEQDKQHAQETEYYAADDNQTGGDDVPF